MQDLRKSCRLAVVQAAPVMFSAAESTEKALRLIDECSEGGADFVVFPELFIPGYPYGMTFGYTVGSRTQPGRRDWLGYYENSILADGEEMRALREAAKKAGIYLSIGYSERDAVTATLYNSNMLIASAWSGETLTATSSPCWVRPGARWAVSSAGRATCPSRALRSMRRA